MAQPSTAAVRFKKVTKRFGSVTAVDQVELTFWGGEIHAILGENGAGKTSLMSILAGLYQPDAGQLEVQGRPVAFSNPRQAMAAGIGMVHQHFMLVPTLTVAENIILGADPIPWHLRPQKLAQQVEQAAQRLGIAVDPRALVGTLSLGEQQRVEILRVLFRGAKVMVLDEPTAVLSPQQTEALFASLRQLAAQGCAVVIISHKLNEIKNLAQRVTVMHRGGITGQFEHPEKLSDQELAAAMVGHDVSLHVERRQVKMGPPVLTVSHLSVKSDRGLPAVQRLNLKVRSSEILGLAGVAGNGQLELMEAVAGLRPVEQGEIQLDGHQATGTSPARRVALGLRFIPEDRQHTGTAPSLSVAENLLLRDYRKKPCRRGIWLRPEALRAQCEEKVEALQIATASLEQNARLLSGGNLQKVILARELCQEVRTVLAMYPTRGLDAWATSQVRRLLLEARCRGAGVLLCSEDLEEVLALSDRVAVMVSGRIVYEVSRQEAELAVIGKKMMESALQDGRPGAADAG